VFRYQNGDLRKTDSSKSFVSETRREQKQKYKNFAKRVNLKLLTWAKVTLRNNSELKRYALDRRKSKSLLTAKVDEISISQS